MPNLLGATEVRCMVSKQFGTVRLTIGELQVFFPFSKRDGEWKPSQSVVFKQHLGIVDIGSGITFISMSINKWRELEPQLKAQLIQTENAIALREQAKLEKKRNTASYQEV